MVAIVVTTVELVKFWIASWRKIAATARLARTIINQRILPPDFTCPKNAELFLKIHFFVTLVKYFQPWSPVVSQNSLNIITAKFSHSISLSKLFFLQTSQITCVCFEELLSTWTETRTLFYNTAILERISILNFFNMLINYEIPWGCFLSLNFLVAC